MSYVNEVIRICDDLYCIRDVKSVNKYLIIGKERALLLDTGFGFVDPRPVIRSLTQLPLIVVNTHGDIDHAAGNFWFDEVYLSPYDYRNLSHIEHRVLRRQQMEYRLNKPGSLLAEEMDADDWIKHGAYECRYRFMEDGERFDLGGRVLEVIAVPGHTAGSIALLDRTRQLLFTGDSVMKYNVFMTAVCSPEPPYELLRPNEPLAVFLHSLRRLKQRACEARLLYPGHGEMGISPRFIDDLIENLLEICEQKGVHERFTTYRGSSAIRHAYKDTLVYYDDDTLSEYRRQHEYKEN